MKKIDIVSISAIRKNERGVKGIEDLNPDIDKLHKIPYIGTQKTYIRFRSNFTQDITRTPMKKNITILLLTVFSAWCSLARGQAISPRIFKPLVWTFTIPGATNTYINAINNKGQMAGYYTDATGIHGFVFDGMDTVFLNFGNSPNTYVYGINDNGIVVGAYNNDGSNSSNEGFFYDMESGAYTDFTSGWSTTVSFVIARDVNNEGRIIGDVKSTGTNHICFSYKDQSFTNYYYYWGGIKQTYINSINTNRHHVGYWLDGLNRHGLYYNQWENQWRQIDYPGASKTVLTGINDDDVMTGNFNLSQSFICRRYPNNVDSFFRVLKDGASDFQIRDINNSGLIAGSYKPAGSSYYVGFYSNIYDNGFRPRSDGWIMANAATPMWSPVYYNKIKYDHDPYLGGEAPFPGYYNENGEYRNFPGKMYPDWPLFVKAFGEESCYKKVNGVLKLRQTALEFWNAIGHLDGYSGACNGFVVSSILAFRHRLDFNLRFNTLNWEKGNGEPTEELYELPPYQEEINCVNELQMSQYRQATVTWQKMFRNSGPTETLEALKPILRSPTASISGLTISDRRTEHSVGSHIVVPYRIIPDSFEYKKNRIYVYDNNFPGDTTRYVTVDLQNDAFSYRCKLSKDQDEFDFGGPEAHQGLYLELPANQQMQRVSLDDYLGFFSSKDQNDSMVAKLFISKGTAIMVTNSLGQVTGIMGEQVREDIPGSGIISPAEGLRKRILGVSIPLQDFRVRLSTFTVASASLHYFDGLSAMRYQRQATALGDSDILRFGSSGVTVQNPGETNRKVSIQAAAENDSLTMTIQLTDLIVGHADSLAVGRITVNGELQIQNYSSQSQYNITITDIGGDEASVFTADSIAIPPHTVHIIHPFWDSLSTLGACVFVDFEGNLSIDDTLFLVNTSLPEILTTPAALSRQKSAFQDTVFVNNNGGGILAWEAASTDTTWLHITGSTNGTNNGWFLVSGEPAGGAHREADIIISAAGAANSPYRIHVVQNGILKTPERVLASDGTMKDTVEIRWTQVPDAGYYRVYKSTVAGIAETAVTSWIEDTTAYDISVERGREYFYTVKTASDSLGSDSAQSVYGDIGYSACFTAHFTAGRPCTGIPLVFTDSTNSHSPVFHCWDLNNDGINEYLGPVVTKVFPEPGIYTVRLTVTDSIGCSDTVSMAVEVQSFPAVLLPTDTTACASTTVVLSAGPGFASYQWSDGTMGPGTTLDTAGTGFQDATLYISVTGGLGCSSLQLVTVHWDTCVQPASEINGRITYDNSVMTPLTAITVDLVTDTIVISSVVSDSLGNYRFTQVTPGNYFLRCSSSKPWGGVNSTDALKILRHFTGLTLLEGLRIPAADVNGSQSVNSIDALLIAKRFVALTSSFEVGDWIFDNPEILVTETTTIVQDIKGLTYGDVDGSYIPPQ